MRILLIEDDPDLAEVLLMGLRNAAYATDLASTRRQAEDSLMQTNYDVVCIDLGLPDGDGLDLIRQIGTDELLMRPRRIIIITARDAVNQRIAGLDAGADDYLVKPFAFGELLARIRAVSRRDDQFDQVLHVRDVRMDTAAHAVTRGGAPIMCTPREFALLRYFLQHPGQAMAAEELLEHVWDANTDPFTSSVRVIISRLRRKLGEPALIRTIPQVGYVLEDAP